MGVSRGGDGERGIRGIARVTIVSAGAVPTVPKLFTIVGSRP